MDRLLFAKKLIKNRKQLGITQQQLAEFVDVSKAAVSKWEKGQSYPDITLLPRLATYFNTTIDDLLGYEPQMTTAHIRAVYAQFAEEFGQRPFDEVKEEIDILLNEYYACYPLVLQMAQLYMNYYKLAGEPHNILQQIDEMCERIKLQAKDTRLVYEAEILQSYTKLERGQYEEVLGILGEEVGIYYNTEELIALALTMRGDGEKAKEILQVSMFQHMVGYVSSATSSLQHEMENKAHFHEIVERTQAFMKLFTLQKMNIHMPLVFYLQAAAGYMLQQEKERAIAMLEQYCLLCLEIQFPIELRGDQYFYLLDHWVAKNIHLGPQAPRDEHSIKHDLVASITSQPLFKEICEDEKIKKMMHQLVRYLQIEGV